jgi:hypothetical protein
MKFFLSLKALPLSEHRPINLRVGKVELIWGMLRDPHFGQCVMFGIDGIMAETVSETVSAVAPLSLQEYERSAPVCWSGRGCCRPAAQAGNIAIQRNRASCR